jgi:hypothetical protein
MLPAMLDNLMQTVELIALMKDHLPIAAMIPPPLAKLLSQQAPGVMVPRTADITDIEYLGDEGGIMCILSFAKPDEAEDVFVVSLTHLKIDGRHPLSRRIATYQKRRTKKVVHEHRMMAFAESYGLLNTRANI